MRVVVLIVVLALASIGSAQSARPGMRLTVTRVAPTGGFTANGFLVVHTTTIHRTPAPACGVGAMRIDAEGHDARGRIRSAHIVAIARAEEGAVDVGTGPYAARIEVALEDGALVVTRGTVRAHLVGGSGLDATLDGSVIDAAGVPTTVTGHIVLSPAP